jgi:hypothetical protein
MAATDRFMNWGPVSLGGTVIVGVQECTFDEGLSTKEESGDFDTGPTVSLVDWRNPFFTVRTLNAGAQLTVAAGTKGIFVATLRDAYNGATASGGAKVFTTNALSYVGARSIQGAHREFATQMMTIKTTNADGATNPVTVTTL